MHSIPLHYLRSDLFSHDDCLMDKWQLTAYHCFVSMCVSFLIAAALMGGSGNEFSELPGVCELHVTHTAMSDVPTLYPALAANT